MSILDDYIKDGYLRKGDDPKLILRRLSSGIPQLDDILGGGWPYGRNTMLVGPESTGKSLLAQSAIALQQHQSVAPGAALIDCERSYDPDWWAASGVDIKELIVSQPPTGEAAVDIMAALLKDKDIGIVVLDSIPTMTPTYVSEHGATEGMPMASTAQLCGLMYQKTLPLLNDKIFIQINQIREAMTAYAEEVYPGGRAVRHNSHVILRTRRQGWLDEGTGAKKVRVGFTMEINCRKNKTAEPQKVCQIPFRFKGQLDLLASIVDEGINMGLIEVRGGWYYYNGYKFQGKTNLRNYFVEQDDVYRGLEHEVMMKEEEE